MVNTLLVVVCGLSLVVWLVQEQVAGRPAEQEPGWSRLAYRLVLAAWLIWLAAAVWIKDGDFAFVLVMLTLLAGVIVLLDRLWFARRRAGRREEGARAEPREIAEHARSFFPVLLVVLVLRSFIVEPFQIPSSSMEPTLEVGDYILVNKFSYGLRLPVLGTKIFEVGEPRRGDVIVFFPPDDPRYFIKRVIGLPGDRLAYRDKVLYINDEPADQDLLALLPPERPVVALLSEQLGEASHLVHNRLRSPAGDFELVVQPDHYFMMGDNRDNSADSRVWGEVPESNIVGQAFAIWMHWRALGELPSFDRVGSIR